ncbi:hypothetical protein FACS189468_7750 [Spirochaetia bacterium]|nr:hypothetical protein FACS189468_7750 [Spirochaetia bacterium]
MTLDSILFIYLSMGKGKYKPGIPLSLLYLSGAIRETCRNIQIFDYNVSGNGDETLDKLLSEINPRIIGINCLFSDNFPSVRRIAGRIKENFPEIKIVIGGIHPTLYAREIMDNCPSIDAIVLGEGDTTFPLLVEYYLTENGGGLLEKLDGVAVRVSDKIMYKEKTRYIHNLDDINRPGYEYFNLSQYRVDTTLMFNPKNILINEVPMPLLTSRSCPNRCYFCAMRLVMGNSFRMHSAQRVFNEIKYLYDKFGINYFEIADDNFAFNRQRALDICNLIIKNKLNIYLHFFAGLMIRTLDDEVINALCSAGGIRFSLAVESGSDYIRNTILKKNCSKQKIVDTVNAFKKYNVLVNAFFIIGFPEETEETLNETAELIDALNTDSIALNKLLPIPGTALFTQCLRDNLFCGNIDIDEMWKGDSEIYYTQLNKLRMTDFLIKPYQLEMDKLEDYNTKIEKIITQKSAKTLRTMLKKEKES